MPRRTMKLIAGVFSATLAAQSTAQAALDYAGTSSSEAILTYRFQVHIASPTAPSKKIIRRQIEKQVLHLAGPMISAAVPGISKMNHQISDVGSPEKTGNHYRVAYSYRGTIVVATGSEERYELLLPFDPDAIYAASGVHQGKNPCTDESYNEAETFWYFWSPARPNCKLKEGVDFARIEARLRRLPNSISTYPEYERLVRGAGAERKIVISLFIGMDDPERNGWDPATSKDESAYNYRKLRATLVGQKFSPGTPWSRPRLTEYLGKSLDDPFYVEELEKPAKNARLVVRLYFGPTGLDQKSRVFHWLYREALAQSSIVIYDGHSGFGDHLYLDKIESKESFSILPSSEYQIYYINSCSSYAYYNREYFERKRTEDDPKGTRALDLITNGLLSPVFAERDANATVIGAIADWAERTERMSYQTLMKKMDDRSLIGVLGDEDNRSSR